MVAVRRKRPVARAAPKQIARKRKPASQKQRSKQQRAVSAARPGAKRAPSGGLSRLVGRAATKAKVAPKRLRQGSGGPTRAQDAAEATRRKAAPKRRARGGAKRRAAPARGRRRR